MPNWLEEYLKHFVLNLWQACQGVRYLFSHPTSLAPVGSPEHVSRSAGLWLRLIGNDLLFAVLPRWHHSAEELSGMRDIPFRRWFQYGYCAWRFTETGDLRIDLNVDRRWDPRCDD